MIYPLPAHALLARYQDEHYTDCFSVVFPGRVSHRQYIQAFYKTWLFRLERFVLRWLAKKPSSDDDVDRLARGEARGFAAWTVEDRATDQLLLCDFRGTTRSWLMVEPMDDNTRLYFGSAVIRSIEKEDGSREMGRSFSVLLGLHKFYSRCLLGAATRKLKEV